MKTLKKIFFVLIFLAIVLPNYSQEKTVILQRTPEQEAAKQTDKLQQELNLNSNQTKQVYEINLKYARERQVSNTRSAAVERTKNKNAAIERILSDKQNYRLQTKRYERTTIEIPSENKNTHTKSTDYKSMPNNLSNPTIRVPSVDDNLHKSYRSVHQKQKTSN